VSAVEGAAVRAPKETIEIARRLRRALSPPEARLWSRLRAREPGAPVFRRQHPIGPYVIDFYCAKARLAVEDDGISHDMGDHPQRDGLRGAWLRTQGLSVVRVAAIEVMRDIDEVVDALVRAAAERIEVLGKRLGRGEGPLHRASRGPPPPLRRGGWRVTLSR
jgi:very-short-patch-repair endonuclease